MTAHFFNAGISSLISFAVNFICTRRGVENEAQSKKRFRAALLRVVQQSTGDHNKECATG